MTTGERKCHRPPTGWQCTREADHLGPCAAISIVDTKPKHVDCDSYTDPQPVFRLYKEQRELIQKWVHDHNVEKHGSPHPYGGAIGGRITYEFTNTSIGTVEVVRCTCGEAIDVSDYDNW